MIILVVAAGFTPLCVSWQSEQFAKTGVPGGPPNLFLVIIATLAACLGLLYLARGLRAISRSIATKIGRRTSWPFTVRTLLGGISVFVGVLVVVAAGLALSMVFFNKMNNSTAGQTPP